MIELTEADHGARRTLVRGEEIVIRLAENPTTGYRWAIDAGAAGVDVLDDQNDAGGDGALGASSVRVLRLRKTASGPVLLRLIRRREWALGEADARFEATLEDG